MRIIDETGKEIVHPDLDAGYLKPDQIVKLHHDAVPEVPEVSHEVETTFPNGSSEIRKVIDTPHQDAQMEWDEYEDVIRYVLYTSEELNRIAAEKEAAAREAQRLPNLEAAMNQVMHIMSKIKIPGGGTK